VTAQGRPANDVGGVSLQVEARTARDHGIAEVSRSPGGSVPLLPASLIEPLWVEFAALIGSRPASRVRPVAPVGMSPPPHPRPGRVRSPDRRCSSTAAATSESPPPAARTAPCAADCAPGPRPDTGLPCTRNSADRRACGRALLPFLLRSLGPDVGLLPVLVGRTPPTLSPSCSRNC
jgi:hypothetical protein